MAHSTSEDGFREIQLNGKQLVFLFMAATVVSVVIFLSGVLVGRGARQAEAGPAAQAAVDPLPAEAPPAGDLPAASESAPTPPPDLPEPPPTPDELSYHDRLDSSRPPAETLRSALVERASAPPRGGADELVPGPPLAVAPAPAGPPVASGAPAGPGYAVQVAALRARGEADEVARRLTDKGYPAYVMAPSDGAPASIYRVRVGKFGSREEAERVASRLEREEQFKSWIIR